VRAAGPKPAAVYADVFRTYARRWPSVLAIGAVIVVPLGLLDAVAEEAGSIELPDSAALVSAAPTIVVVLLAALTSLIGDIFYSGAIASLVDEPDRPRRSLLALARGMALRRLVAVDLLVGVGAAIGAVLFVIPGVVIFIWYALAGPLVEMEGLRIRDALARSRRLVRGRFWRVFIVLVPLVVGSELVGEAAAEAIEGVVGRSFLATWLTESALNLLVTPLYAIAAVLLTLSLLRTEAGAGERPAAT
jgi:hypothetical protein